MGRWSRAAGEAFVDWLSLPQGLRWLDVGCGTGAFTQVIHDRCSPQQVDALDPAKDQIAYALRRLATPQVRFQIGDAQSLPFADNEFDIAVMALVISFVPDPVKAITEMARVTRPGGTVAAYIWDTHGRCFLQEPLRDALQALNVEVPRRVDPAKFHPKNLQRLFISAGLSQIEHRTIEIVVSYKDFNEYWTAQTGLPNTVVQAVLKLGERDVERLKDYLRASLLIGKSRRIAYTARANAIRGRVPH